jgi:hypothetical protein
MYSSRMETVPFFHLFTREGNIEYTGSGNTKHGQRTALIAILSRLAGREGLGSMVFKRACSTPWLEQKCSAASYCQLQATVSCRLLSGASYCQVQAVSW